MSSIEQALYAQAAGIPAEQSPEIESSEENFVDKPEEQESLVILSGISSSNEIVVVGSSSSSMIDLSDIRHTEALINESRLLQQEEDKLEANAIDHVGADQTIQITLNLWDILKKSAVNVILPFINGMMLGFGEILAHEIGFRYNWIGAKVQPARRMRREPSKYL